MEVIATRPGFHGVYRSEGDRFEVPDDWVSSWFEPVDHPAAPEPVIPSLPVKRKPGRPPKVRDGDV